MSESDDEHPQLSAHALAALNEFYTEREEALSEDWALSQFWYTEETAERIAREAARAAGTRGRVACVSAPSVYQKLKNTAAVSVVLLEYDRRFAVYGDDFIFYDYANPLFLPERILAHSFDIVVADPPYLSQECLTKVAVTIKFLAKAKVLLCTGATMQEHAETLLGLKMCSFIPKHKHNLANEFRCYVNYPSELDSCGP